MANGGKGRWIIIAAGVICLVAGPIMWFRDGFSTEEALTPFFFTLLSGAD
jgi:hypothetical protein